jgi:hypothetical protein
VFQVSTLSVGSGGAHSVPTANKEGLLHYHLLLLPHEEGCGGQGRDRAPALGIAKKGRNENEKLE